MKEFKFIEEIAKRAGRPSGKVITGIGDDCAVMEYDKGHYLLWGTDMLIEGTHFRIKDTTLDKVGRKAVAVNISDIAAMGGRPEYITVSLGVPSGMALSGIRRIYNGIFKLCGKYGIKVIGGDTVRSDKLVISVSIMGIVKKKRLVKRSDAKKGDLVLITGPVRDGKRTHLDFVPRLEESDLITTNCKVGAMIDTSDGIAMDISRICSASGVGCRLYADAVPLVKGLSLKDALYFGESFELLFTLPPKETRKLLRKIRSYGKAPGIFVIGEVTSSKEGMKLVEKEGRIRTLEVKGFSHL